jgi:hypothetical protein
MIRPLGESNGKQRLVCSLVALTRGHLGVQQRQLHVFGSAGSREKVELLEDKPDFSVPNLSKLIAIEVPDVDSVQRVRPGSGCVETAKDVHQRGFAGT